MGRPICSSTFFIGIFSYEDTSICVYVARYIGRVQLPCHCLPLVILGRWPTLPNNYIKYIRKIDASPVGPSKVFRVGFNSTQPLVRSNTLSTKLGMNAFSVIEVMFILLLNTPILVSAGVGHCCQPLYISTQIGLAHGAQ